MAKRYAGRPIHAHRSAVTPRAKGADTSKQRPAQNAEALKPFPFPIRPPKANDDESGLYSQVEDVPMTKRTGRNRDAVRAAQARMTGTPIEEDDLDSLGEALIGQPQVEEAEEEENTQDDDAVVVPPPSAAPTSVELANILQPFMDALRADILNEVSMRMGANTAVTPAAPTATVTATATTVVPASTPAPAAAFELGAERVSQEDVDRLWDWIRADPASSVAFFNHMPKTSQQLQRIITAMMHAEESGVGMIRSLVIDRGASQPLSHIGFAMLAPIFAEEKMAILHLYLSQGARGQLVNLLEPLCALAALQLPGYKFAVVPNSPAQERLYGTVLARMGFTRHTMFVR